MIPSPYAAIAALGCAVGLLLPVRMEAAPNLDLEKPLQVTRKTTISIQGQSFLINGQPTYPGRTYQGHKVEGLLFNARLVQGIFDDLNPETRERWKYPDGPWDSERNTREFVAAMPEWRRHGLVSFTIDFQGGSPEGYSKSQPWINSAFEPDGALRPAYMDRLEKILDRADELGMAPIVSFFYQGQAPRFVDEAAVIRATENATDWLLSKGYTNVLIEIGNEVNANGYPPIIKPRRVTELIQLVQERSRGRVKTPAGRFLVSASLTGDQVPQSRLVKAADFVLLHGNGVGEPDRIREMIRLTRAVEGYRGQPVVFNEDDHYEFEQQDNNMLAALEGYASWGYFDFRRGRERFEEGYQSVPVDWGIASARKRGFFGLLEKVTGE